MGGGGGGVGGSSVFQPLVRGGSLNFQLPLRGGSSCFFYGDWHTFDNKGNSFQTIEASDTLKHQPGIGSHGQLFRRVLCTPLLKPQLHTMRKAPGRLWAGVKLVCHLLLLFANSFQLQRTKPF